MTLSSLRLKLAVWLLLPLLALLGFDAWLTYQRAMGTANMAFDRTLFTSAKAIAEGVRLDGDRLQVDLPYLALELFEANSQGRVFYRVAEGNGSTLPGYADLPLPAGNGPPAFRPQYYEAPFRDDTLRLIALRQPVYDVSRGSHRSVWVLVGETPELRRQLAREILIGSLQQEVVLVSLALAIVLFAIGHGLKPLDRLSAALGAQRGDRLQALDTRDLPTEIRPLVTALNRHVERMQQMLSARRRFFDDAAHQLKTPLAVIQAQTELALREQDPAVLHQRLRGQLHTLHQASPGVQQLLSLSRLAPASGLVAPSEPGDLAALARDVALEWSPVARRHGIDLGYDGEQHAWMEGQPALLQEMIGNLIDNAIRHAGPRLTVAVTTSPDGPRLAVIDNGPGIAPAERDKVFSRFYRVAGTRADGSGLGLAIVREIAHRHAARIRLDDTPGGGLTVHVSFAGHPAPP